MKTDNRPIDELFEDNARLKDRIHNLESIVDEQKRAYSKLEGDCVRLRSQEEKYRTIVQKSREAIFVIRDGIMVFVNRPDSNAIGYSVEDMTGRRFSDFIHPADRNMVVDRYRQRAAGENPPAEYAFRVLHRNGSTRWVEIHASPIVWEGTPATLNLMLDITGRVKAEMDRNAGAEEYRKLTERINDVVWMAGLDMRTYYNSPSIEKVLGYTPEERNDIPLEKVVTPSTLAFIEKRMEEELILEISGTADPHRAVALEMEYYHKDGSTRWMENIITSVRGQKGEMSGIYGVSRDITARKRAEAEREVAVEALRESEERYREILDAMQETYYETDLKGTLLFFSSAAVRNLGYSVAELEGMNFNHLVSPENEEKVFQAYHQVFTGGEPLKGLTWELVCKDGSTLSVESSVDLKKNASGETVGFRGVVRDVNDRTRAEEALRASEARYRLITDKMNDIIWTADLNLRLTYISPSDQRIFGFTLEDRMAQSVEEFITPESLERSKAELSRELERDRGGDVNPYRSVVIDLEYYHRDGSTRWLETVVGSIRNEQGKLTGVQGVARDVTDRKKAEQALRESQERYQEVFQTSPDSITLTRLSDDRYFEVNGEYLRMTGFTRDEVIGKTVKELHIWNDPGHREVFLKELSETGRVRNMDAHFRMKDGRVTTGLVSAGLLTIEAERYIQTIARDITDMREMEAWQERERKEREELERQLSRAQKLESIGTLAGGIAHDFNNLLMGIQGHASLVMRDLEPFHPHYIRLKYIEEQVESGAGLTSQLLGFARGGRYEVKSISLNELIEKTSAMFGRTKKEVTIQKRFEPDLWNVEADQIQMEQVFMNLYVNAWQAMPGGGELYLETENVFLDEGKAQPFELEPGVFVKVSVTDTGIGMDSRTRERIFDPFFSTKAMGRGTGLGLATVYGIVRGHRGMINVYSEPGRGTIFTLYLPASSDMHSAQEISRVEESIVEGSETILLVDDEAMVLDVSRELLESLGYTVHIAGSGQEALAVYREQKDDIDLVILDMIMPGISGSGAFDQLREINPDVRILLSSGYSDNGEAKIIMDRGCDGFLQKPFLLHQLSKKVRDVLDQ